MPQNEAQEKKQDFLTSYNNFFNTEYATFDDLYADLVAEDALMTLEENKELKLCLVACMLKNRNVHTSTRFKHRATCSINRPNRFERDFLINLALEPEQHFRSAGDTINPKDPDYDQKREAIKSIITIALGDRLLCTPGQGFARLAQLLESPIPQLRAMLHTSPAESSYYHMVEQFEQVKQKAGNRLVTLASSYTSTTTPTPFNGHAQQLTTVAHTPSA